MDEIREMLQEQRDRDRRLEARERLATFTTLANFEARLVIRGSTVLVIALFVFAVVTGITSEAARWAVLAGLLLLAALSIQSWMEWRGELTKARRELRGGPADA